MLRGLVPRDGGVIESVQHLSDDPAAIREALLAPGADVILTYFAKEFAQRYQNGL